MESESLEKVSYLHMCPMEKDKNQKEIWPIPETVIQHPMHGMAGRRMISKEGTKVYEMVKYHHRYGWMSREEARDIWQQLNYSQKFNFPAIDW